MSNYYNGDALSHDDKTKLWIAHFRNLYIRLFWLECALRRCSSEISQQNPRDPNNAVSLISCELKKRGISTRTEWKVNDAVNESAPEIRGATTRQDEGCARKQLIKCCHDWKTQNCNCLECCHDWKTQNCWNVTRNWKKTQNCHSSKYCRDEPECECDSVFRRSSFKRFCEY